MGDKFLIDHINKMTYTEKAISKEKPMTPEIVAAAMQMVAENANAPFVPNIIVSPYVPQRSVIMSHDVYEMLKRYGIVE